MARGEWIGGGMSHSMTGSYWGTEDKGVLWGEMTLLMFEQIEPQKKMYRLEQQRAVIRRDPCLGGERDQQNDEVENFIGNNKAASI